MKKGLGVLAVLLLTCAFAGQAGAFCVHNGSDREMIFRQIYGGSFWRPFSVKLAPTDSACCNWQNTDCNNMDGGKGDPVGFDVRKVVEGWLDEYVCQDILIRADSDLYVYKKNDNYVCDTTRPPMPPVPPPPPFPGQ